jgi:hypothetical protein
MQVHLVKDISLPFLFQHPLVFGEIKIGEIPAQKRRNLKKFAECG